MNADQNAFLKVKCKDESCAMYIDVDAISKHAREHKTKTYLDRMLRGIGSIANEENKKKIQKHFGMTISKWNNKPKQYASCVPKDAISVKQIKLDSGFGLAEIKHGRICRIRTRNGKTRLDKAGGPNSDMDVPLYKKCKEYYKSLKNQRCKAGCVSKKCNEYTNYIESLQAILSAPVALNERSKRDTIPNEPRKPKKMTINEVMARETRNIQRNDDNNPILYNNNVDNNNNNNDGSNMDIDPFGVESSRDLGEKKSLDNMSWLDALANNRGWGANNADQSANAGFFGLGVEGDGDLHNFFDN